MKTWWAGVVALVGATVVGCHEGAGDVDATTSSTRPDSIGVQDTEGNVPGSCTAAYQCADFYDGCKVTTCENGQCVSEPKETGAFCTAPTLVPAECETTRCDSAGLCVIAPVADGAACGPEDACTLGTCAAGACDGKVVPADCDDGNPCTIDGCGAEGCTNTPSNAACDDGDSCTSGDVCSSGTCSGTPSCDCETDADCTASDANLCDGTSKCTGGKCVNDPKTAVVCPEAVTAGPCEAPVCNPATGTCSLQIAVGQACSDGIACTSGDACNAAGECESTTVVCEFDCADEADDDGDEKTDCEDTDCTTDSACAVTPECTTASDCPPIANVCLTRTCDDGQCGEVAVIDETPVPDQTPGDCQLLVCDGDGDIRSMDDAGDLPTSKTACLTDPACAGTPLAPSFTAVSAGTSCSADALEGKTICGDGAAEGTCVACNSASDCPATGNECIAATCVDHVCGTENLGESVTATEGQSPGDCQKLVCNGAGGTKSVDDPEDVPTSTTVCLTNPTCAGTPLAPAFTPAAPGTDCSVDGVSTGAVCGEGVMAGVCGECNTPDDCPVSDNECVAATCIENTCGTEDLGTSVEVSEGQDDGDCQVVVCDGDGGTTSVDDPDDLPTSNTACLINPACTGEPLAPSFTPAPAGADCSSDGLVGKDLCGDGESAGTCVACNTATDCPAPGGACQVATCIDHVCGVGAVPAGGDALSGQAPGDCQKLVCNEVGVPVPEDDATDAPASPSACLVNPTCAGDPLLPDFDPAPTGTSCSSDGLAGKTVCGDTASLFAGTCVECVNNTQCPGKVCDVASATCVAAPSCSDGQKNGFESDIDCGGPCPKCPNDKSCLVNADCTSGLCSAGTCVALTNGCSPDTANDQTAAASATITFANGNFTYAPKCLKVKAGTPVTFNGSFGSHPLIGGTVVGNTATPAVSGPFVPVTNTGTTKTFTMSTAGTFPYYCQPHGTIGMNGVVYVVP